MIVETEMPASLRAMLRRHIPAVRSHHFQFRDNTEMGDLVLTGEPGTEEGQYTLSLTRSLRGDHETLLRAVYLNGELDIGTGVTDDVWTEGGLEEFLAAVIAGGDFKAAPAWEQVHLLTAFHRATPSDEELRDGEVEIVE